MLTLRSRRRGPSHGPTLFELASLSAFGVLFRDDFLAPAEASRVRSQGLKLARSNQMKAAGVGRGQRHQLAPQTRGDRIAWVESQGVTPGFQPFLTQLERLRRDLNQKAYLGLRRFELQCSYHEAGSPGYKRHTDTFADHGARRRLSAVYYLNPGWRPEHGGSLTIHLPTGPLEVEPVHNRLVLFLSDIEHEVAPVQAPRLAMTAWFYCQ